MTRKQMRVFERDIQTLFSIRAFLRGPSMADIKRLSPFPRIVKLNTGTLFMSEQGVAALKRLIESFASFPVLSDAVSIGEIDDQVNKNYRTWLVKGLQPTGQEFVDETVGTLLGQVKSYEFLVKIEGIGLNDIDMLKLGSVRIQLSEPALFEQIAFGGNLDREYIYSQFKDSYWLIGAVTGSSDIAFERFENRSIIVTGILGLCGAVLYEGAIWRSRVRVVTSPLENRKAVSTLSWEKGGANPSISHNWGGEQILSLSADSIAYLSETCFLKQLSDLPDIENRNELEDAILRAIYWFADAYRDRNPIMQFIKLWTCMECFFAIDKEQVTELNARGIASILVFAGFSIVEVEDYSEFKRKVKRLYSLRSKAIHRAEFSHVDLKDLNELSHWVAWVVISMVALAERGYETLLQVHEQTQRLDQISSRG